MDWAIFIPTEFHGTAPMRVVLICIRWPFGRTVINVAYGRSPTQLRQRAETAGATPGPYADISGGHYEGRTDCRKPASFAVALYCGIGSSSLNALVKAFDRLHMVRAWKSSCTG